MDPSSRARVLRSEMQRLYLVELNSTMPGAPWIFEVMGTTGRKYSVVLAWTYACCSCPDFKQRGRLCKHIYFIYTRVLQRKEYIRDMIGDDCQGPFITDEIDAELVERLSALMHEARLKPGQAAGGAPTDTATDTGAMSQVEKARRFPNEDCCICFEAMVTDPSPTLASTSKGRLKVEALVHCDTCEHDVHRSCFARWESQTCPLCRTPSIRNAAAGTRRATSTTTPDPSIFAPDFDHAASLILR
jgi:hypothetical protein